MLSKKKKKKPKKRRKKNIKTVKQAYCLTNPVKNSVSLGCATSVSLRGILLRAFTVESREGRKRLKLFDFMV